MGGRESKPVGDAFFEDGKSIISEIEIDYFSNYKKNEQIYICIVFIILLIISIHFLHRRR